MGRAVAGAIGLGRSFHVARGPFTKDIRRPETLYFAHHFPFACPAFRGARIGESSTEKQAYDGTLSRAARFITRAPSSDASAVTHDGWLEFVPGIVYAAEELFRERYRPSASLSY